MSVVSDATECRSVELARERQERDLAKADKRGFVYDEDAAQRVITFFAEYLRHTKGEWGYGGGQPFELAPWQAEDIIRPLFGWKREDGTRRFRTAYLELPRKNGKTSLAAGLGLYFLVADNEPGAEIYSAATKRDQAKIAFDMAQAMVSRSLDLRRFVKVHRYNLSVPETGSKFEPLGADSQTLDGLNPHALIIDELHAHRDRRVYDVLTTAMAARAQPMTLMITTAGVYEPESIGYQMHEYAQRVLEGTVEDDSFFAYITAADAEDDWTDPDVWRKANPNLGISVREDYLREQCARAKSAPSFVNSFLRYHLDIWTEVLDRWLAMDVWEDCGGMANEVDLEGAECYAGVDLATTTDIAAFVLAFPQSEGRYELVCRFWVPEDRIVERSKRDRVPYDAWARDGFIVATPGNVIDYDIIRAEINQLGQRFRIREIAFDPWNATQIATQLGEQDGFQVIQMRQGTRTMSEPSREFERLLMAGKLNHQENPVLRWMASNVALYEDSNGNIKPDKKRSGDRIDGIVAAIMAIGRATVTRPARLGWLL